MQLLYFLSAGTNGASNIIKKFQALIIVTIALVFITWMWLESWRTVTLSLCRVVDVVFCRLVMNTFLFSFSFRVFTDYLSSHISRVNICNCQSVPENRPLFFSQSDKKDINSIEILQRYSEKLCILIDTIYSTHWSVLYIVHTSSHVWLYESVTRM